jgi:hypothetical protein
MSDQSATCEPAPPAEHWVELRIHGVSGTPPESMLESAHVKQVAGDSWGRFFRPVNGVGDELQPCPNGVPRGRLLEGYHWGKYTSGSWIKGLWLILIPFGLVNAAAFMCPRPKGKLQRSLRFAIQSLIRGVGIGVTATFALAASLICIDVLAYQWATDLDVLHKLGFGRVLGLGVVLAAATVTALFVLGNQNRVSDFGKAEDDSIADSTKDVDDDHPPSGLTRRPFFFVAEKSSPVLGRLHLSAGFCVVIVVATLLWDTIVAADTMTTRTSIEDGLRHWALGLLVLITLATAIGGDVGGAVRGTPLGKRSTRVMEMSGRLALAASLAMLVTAAWILTSVGRSDTPLNVDSYTQWLALISGLTMVLLLVANAALAAITWPTSATPEPFRRYAFGMAPWAATSAGVFLAVGFCSASVLGVAKAVGSTADTEFIHRVSYSWGITAVLGLIMALALMVLWLVRGWGLVARATAAYTTVSEPLGGPGPLWWGKIARAMSMAKLKFCVPPPLVVFAVSGLAMTFVTFAEMRSGDDVRWVGWLSETEPVATRADPDPTIPTHISFLTNLGTLTLIGLAGLLFYLGRRSLRAENARRGANVLWDVLSFWPHAAHPFVPPAYSQFAVHDLRRRIVFHLSSPDVPEGEPPAPPRATSVVISAHSQGSLVTLAALLWLSPAHLARVGLVTYGSQLQVAYPRGFPAFVDFALLRQVQECLGRRWVNLYRETDPIAGPVLSWHRTRMTAPPTAGSLASYRLESPDAPEADTYPFPPTGRRESGHDWRVLDPPPVDAQRQIARLTLLSRHSGYPSSDDYPPAVSQVKPA